MRASKVKAQKEREKEKARREKEAALIAANAERLKSMTSGFGLILHGKKVTPSRQQSVSNKDTRAKPMRDFGTTASIITSRAVDPVHVPKDKPVLSEEMQKREAAAQEEIKFKKTLSMPLYNKGGNQYPTQEEIKAMRNGELRRRS